MKDKVCVFVDGENFRHTIVDLFDQFSPYDYLPKNADWGNLFDWLVLKVSGGNAERLRTYWYVVEQVDFYPYKFPNVDQEPENLKRLLCKDVGLRQSIDKCDSAKLGEHLKNLADRLIKDKNSMQRRFDGWISIQNGIATTHDAIEFRRAGSIRYDLFNKSFGTEKAVDVKLACDLIVLRDIYDTALIISGDQDYVPAVKIVKDSGKKVINVCFKTRGGKLLPGGAWRLNVLTDRSIDVSFNELASHLGFTANGG